LWKEKRFGMFIHWGIYSVTGWHEQYQMHAQIPKEEYIKLADKFKPLCFNADEIVLLAKEAGMSYICFTAKHHDGFCMWDTKYTDYNIMNTPYKKDILKELEQACRRHNIGLSIYYSLPDWHHKNAYNPNSTHQLPVPNKGDEPNMQLYIEYVKNQITELCTNYGEICSLFWDIPPNIYDASVNQLVRTLQPHILINNRGYDEGDFQTPEREIPDGYSFKTPTEACQSVGVQSWGYRKNESYYSKRFLCQSIDKIMCMGGNYVINVGPDFNGDLPEQAVKLIKGIGKWYQSCKKAFDALPATEYISKNDCLYTSDSNNLYIHINHFPVSDSLALDPIDFLPEHAIILNNGEQAKCYLESLPSLCAEGKNKPKEYLQIRDLPIEKFANEVIIIKLSFSRNILDYIKKLV